MSSISSTALIIGENLVDLLVRDDAVEAVIGGGPLNVARTMARLGSSVQFASGISGDAFGQGIAASLTADGVTLLGPVDSPLPTTLAVVTLRTTGPAYHFHLAATASFAIEPPITNAFAVVYLGTLGLLVEPMASIGEALFLAAPPATLTILDPNCRPSATTDVGAYRARLDRLYHRADVVKVSVEDLEFLYPDHAVERGAEAILARGARLVVVTDGPNPVHIVHRDYREQIVVPPTNIVDTVGAGDSLTGGFLSWWMGHHLAPTDLDNAELVHRGVRAAIEISRRTCQQRGAQPPFAAAVTELAEWSWL